MSSILLIALPGRSWEGDLQPNQFPPLGIACLCGFLKKNDVQVEALDLSLDWDEWRKKLAERLCHNQPEFVGLSVFSQVADEAVATIAMIRQRCDAKIILGGPHISVDDGSFVSTSGADYGIKMDGEIPLLGLLTNSVARKTLPVDLDQVYWPDFTLFDLSRYPDWGHAYPIVTSRGCPHRCEYCAAPLVSGRKFRVRSPEHVMREWEWAYSKGFRGFSIGDDAFNMDLPRAKEILQRVVGTFSDYRKSGIKYAMGNGIRADKMDEELAYWMRESGCNYVGFGMESGNQEVLNGLGKRLQLESLREAIKMCKARGIMTSVSVIIGHPSDTWETAAETLEAAEKIGSDTVNVYNLIPFPGTKAKERIDQMVKEGAARIRPGYMSQCTTQGTQAAFETDTLSFKQKHSLMIRGRRLTRKKAFRARLGCWWWIAYVLVYPEWIFSWLHRCLLTDIGISTLRRVQR